MTPGKTYSGAETKERDTGLAGSNLALRVASAVVLIAVTVAAVWAGGYWFELLATAMAAAGSYEWTRMAMRRERPALRQTAIIVAGVLYITAAGWAIVMLRWGEEGVVILGGLFAAVWASDTGGLAVGAPLGGPKLAPRLSPSKTWAGALGALAFAAGACALYAWALGLPVERWTLAALILSVLCQAGDLAESAAKRWFGVKDSGMLIPGHGGVLDRVDGLAAAGLGLGLALWLDPGLRALLLR